MQILKLLQAIIAIAKCAAHKSDASQITQGKNAADVAAKAVAGADSSGEVF